MPTSRSGLWQVPVSGLDLRSGHSRFFQQSIRKPHPSAQVKVHQQWVFAVLGYYPVVCYVPSKAGRLARYEASQQSHDNDSTTLAADRVQSCRLVCSVRGRDAGSRERKRIG